MVQTSLLVTATIGDPLLDYIQEPEKENCMKARNLYIILHALHSIPA